MAICPYVIKCYYDKYNYTINATDESTEGWWNFFVFQHPWRVSFHRQSLKAAKVQAGYWTAIAYQLPSQRLHAPERRHSQLTVHVSYNTTMNNSAEATKR